MTYRDDWRDDAVCTQVDPELFYPADSTGVPAEAEQVCSLCTVRIPCLDEAFRLEGLHVTSEYRHGMWGGLTPRQRSTLAKQRRRAAS